MGIEKKALELVELAYAASLAPKQWQDVMEGFIKSLNSKSAILREANYDARSVGLFQTVQFEPSYVAAYRNHFVKLDYFAPGLQTLPAGNVSCGDHYISWNEQRNTEFYNDYLVPQKTRYCLGITLANSNNQHILFALQRTRQQGEFTEADLKLIRLIAPHMVRAINVHRQIASITVQHRWALSALDRLKTGVILLNDLCQPVFINQKAEHLMLNNCGLSIHRKTLTLINSSDTARLQNILADAINIANGKAGNIFTGGSLETLGASGVRLYIQVIPLPRDKSEPAWDLDSSKGCVAIFLNSSQFFLNTNTLSDHYGFTPAESKLAVLIAEGNSLEHSANILCISVQTARSQLKAVFAKTRVSRQAELVALLFTDMLTININH